MSPLFNKQGPEASLLSKSSCLATALGVTKILAIIAMNMVTIVVLKSDLNV
jgi:hypothetical protein